MNTRLVAALYAIGITLYINFMAGVFSKSVEYNLWFVCCAVLFLVSFFSVHIYYKIEAIEDKLFKKRNTSKRRSVNKDGRSRKKNKS